MPVEVVLPPWGRARFGDAASDVTLRVVQALTDAQRAGAAAQDASRLRAKHPYGSAWTARFEFLADALQDLPGAEVIRPRGAGYRLVMINGCLLVPFLHSKTLTDPPMSRARVPSALLRELTAVAIPQPRAPLALFESDEAGGTASGGTGRLVAGIDPNTPVVYIAFVCNADSDGLLAAWWGTPEAQDKDGNLTWAPEPLPVHLADRHDRSRPTAVAAAPQRTFDKGEIPDLAMDARSRTVETPPTEELRSAEPDVQHDA